MVSAFTCSVDDDGVALVTWNMPGRSMNVIDDNLLDELEMLIERIKNEAAIKGAIFTSAKPAFCAGGDLAMIERLMDGYIADSGSKGEEAAMRTLVAGASRTCRLFRALESTGKPSVAAINGTALGGGLEFCLACHYRVAADDAGLKLGLPEARLGLMPGAGGTQRLPRLIGVREALPLMTQGRNVDPARARKLGLVHDVVSPAGLIDAAKAWLLGGSKPKQPWDEKGFKLPDGSIYAPEGMALWPTANALYRKETGDNLDAQRAIMQAVYEGLGVKSMDAALRIEARHFAKVLKGRQARAMTRTLFTSSQDLAKLARRPRSEPDMRVKKLGVVGAGFMGSGIAYAAAAAGIPCVLIDRDLERAELGKAYSARVVEREIERGRATPVEKEKLLRLIEPETCYERLADADLVIEAVFEQRELKNEILSQAEAELPSGATLASNTSTLPITGLAVPLKRPADFIGIHFFSPVEKMQLVEIIRGKATSDAALARALDFVRQLRKTPIVVNDGRGFFTSRVVLSYIGEGHHMLEEGVPPAMIENGGRMAGMPVGPLALNDEVALDLVWKILSATRSDLGVAYREHASDRILREMVERRARLGRKSGKGFYDYPEGGRKQLWRGLSEIVAPRDPGRFAIEEIKERLLLIQALETAKTFEEGIVTDPREGDVGAILAFGYPAFTGGPLSYIDGLGADLFLARCRVHEQRHGSRYAPPDLLIDMARSGRRFYQQLV